MNDIEGKACEGSSEQVWATSEFQLAPTSKVAPFFPARSGFVEVVAVDLLDAIGVLLCYADVVLDH